MNAFFHTLTGIGVGSTLAPKTASGTPLQKGCAATAAFSLAFLSHGILDGLKHLYPLRVESDLFFSLVLMGVWLLWVKPVYRWFFALTIFGSLLPDLLDHGPNLVDLALGWHLPVYRPWFPWHQVEGDGCFYDSKDPLYSMTNHFIVLSFNTAAILFNRRPLFQPLQSPLSLWIRRILVKCAPNGILLNERNQKRHRQAAHLRHHQPSGRG